MPRKHRWSKEMREAFLKTLKESGNVSAAARAAGVTLPRLYKKREDEPKFRKDWDAALEEALDDLEGELRRRALEGTDKPVYYAGKEVGSVKSFNDNLAMFLLKSRRGQIFGEGDKGQPGEDNPQGLNLPDPKEKLLTKLEGMNTGKAEKK